MREAAFVKQNKDNWIRFENVLSGNHVDLSPDELSALYLEVTDHLSFAKTFYPQSKTTQYLNHLASQSHQKIYKTKRESSTRFITFFTEEFPLLMFNYQRQLLISFLVFALFCIVGAYSAATDGAYVRTILGDAYVNMTLENIADNDPMRVYKEMNEVEMFMGITVNNIKVALMAFIFGILLSLGSLYIMMQNGIMLGSFQYFFYDKGLLWESMRTIWIHGTIEISVIIIAGAAGLVLGNGMKDGLKIVVSTIPFFIIAGFLEGFVTRHTEMPDWLAILIISISLLLILFYYVVYPRIRYKKQLHALDERTDYL